MELLIPNYLDKDPEARYICNICHGSGEAIDPVIREVNTCWNCKGTGRMRKPDKERET